MPEDSSDPSKNSEVIWTSEKSSKSVFLTNR